MACSNNACALTAGSGNSKGLENAMTSCVKGKLESKFSIFDISLGSTFSVSFL